MLDGTPWPSSQFVGMLLRSRRAHSRRMRSTRAYSAPGSIRRTAARCSRLPYSLFCSDERATQKTSPDSRLRSGGIQGFVPSKTRPGCADNTRFRQIPKRIVAWRDASNAVMDITSRTETADTNDEMNRRDPPPSTYHTTHTTNATARRNDQHLRPSPVRCEHQPHCLSWRLPISPNHWVTQRAVRRHGPRSDLRARCS